MRKIILTCVVYFLFGLIPAHAQLFDTCDLIGGDDSIITYVSEPLPGAACCLDASGGAGGIHRRYKCSISLHSGFNNFLGSIYNVTFFFVLVIGVLALTFAGVMISYSGLNQEMRTKAIGLIKKILMGILVLAIVPWILTTVAPWAFR